MLQKDELLYFPSKLLISEIIYIDWPLFVSLEFFSSSLNLCRTKCNGPWQLKLQNPTCLLTNDSLTNIRMFKSWYKVFLPLSSSVSTMFPPFPFFSIHRLRWQQLYVALAGCMCRLRVQRSKDSTVGVSLKSQRTTGLTSWHQEITMITCGRASSSWLPRGYLLNRAIDLINLSSLDRLSDEIQRTD